MPSKNLKKIDTDAMLSEYIEIKAKIKELEKRAEFLNGLLKADIVKNPSNVNEDNYNRYFNGGYATVSVISIPVLKSNAVEEIRKALPSTMVDKLVITKEIVDEDKLSKYIAARKIEPSLIEAIIEEKKQNRLTINYDK